jgi:HPt (histidine-containing phosphotransfer) domain-containing protein
MDGYVTKPIRREVLRKEIDRVTAQNAPAEADGESPDRIARSENEWNVKELLERLEGDQDFFRELLQIFRDDSQANLRKAREALVREDLAELSRAGHTLKGMLRNLSMNVAAETAAALETAARLGARAEAQALLNQLEHSLAGIMAEVETHLAEVGA